MTDFRTFKITAPHMTGDDIRVWQKQIQDEFAKMDIDCPITVDGVWDVASRSYNASLCHALGMIAGEVMADGVTPELRIRIRNRRLTPQEAIRFAERVDYRRDLRARYASANVNNVSRPVTKILEDSWGFHPGVHDGIDIITLPNAPLLAMIKSRIIDVREGGWWGKAPSGDVSKGDGIVQMEILETVGPFIRGRHIGYGHAENPTVSVGEIVRPGRQIATAGLAVAWHIHLMYNGGQTNRGVGTIDPRQILDYAIKNG